MPFINTGMSLGDIQAGRSQTTSRQILTLPQHPRGTPQQKATLPNWQLPPPQPPTVPRYRCCSGQMGESSPLTRQHPGKPTTPEKMQVSYYVVRGSFKENNLSPFDPPPTHTTDKKRKRRITTTLAPPEFTRGQAENSGAARLPRTPIICAISSLTARLTCAPGASFTRWVSGNIPEGVHKSPPLPRTLRASPKTAPGY